MAVANLVLTTTTTYNMTYTHVEDMTGGTVYFTVKTIQFDTDAADADAVIKKNVTSFTNDGLTASWKITSDDTFISPTAKYYYSIVYEDSNGESAPPIFTGKVTFSGHPTNRNMSNT